jgi:hypothetical protein
MKKIFFLSAAVSLSLMAMAENQLARNKFAEHTRKLEQNRFAEYSEKFEQNKFANYVAERQQGDSQSRGDQKRISEPTRVDPKVGQETPIGDGLTALLALTAGYLLVRKRRSKHVRNMI